MKIIQLLKLLSVLREIDIFNEYSPIFDSRNPPYISQLVTLKVKGDVGWI